jgi:toxin ParE1/3/4
VKKYKISFRPLAEADLFALYRHIAREAGEEVAGAYIDRLEAACMAPAHLPRRGTRRGDIRPGLRTIGFERRATIAFQVGGAEVLIIRIFFAGQDVDRALRRRRRSR